MNETAEGCAPRWSRVFSRHHRSSLHPSFASTVFLRFLAPPSSLPFLPSLPPGIPTCAGVFELAKIQGQRASSLDISPREFGRENRVERASNDKKTRTKTQKTKRQRGFPACSQASTNAPQAGLSSLFRWGRLIFCWCERLMGDSARRVCITMMTCIGRETLTGHF